MHSHGDGNKCLKSQKIVAAENELAECIDMLLLIAFVHCGKTCFLPLAEHH